MGNIRKPIEQAKAHKGLVRYELQVSADAKAQFEALV